MSISKNQNILLYGVATYTSGFIMPLILPITSLGTALCTVGLLLLIKSIFTPYSFKFPKDSFFKSIFTIYLIWSLFIFIRGLTDVYDLKDLVYYILDFKFGFITYIIVPLTAIYGAYVNMITKIIHLIYVYSIVFIILIFSYLFPIIQSGQSGYHLIEYTIYVEYFIKSIFLPCTLALLILPLINNWRKYLILTSYLLAIITILFFARRNLIFTITLYSIFAILINFFYKYDKKLKISSIFSIILFSVFVYFYFGDIFNIDKFVFLESRLEEGISYSREGVNRSMIRDFAETPLDYIWGRGGNGTYTDVSDYELPMNQRRSMETGYLAMILKGGVIYLGLHLFILLPAIYRGLFKSNNIIAKASAIMVFVSLLELGPSGFNRASFYSVITWICIGFCYDKKLRSLNDCDIKNVLTISKNKGF